VNGDIGRDAKGRMAQVG
jgi:hypothetical protein